MGPANKGFKKRIKTEGEIVDWGELLWVVKHLITNQSKINGEKVNISMHHWVVLRIEWDKTRFPFCMLLKS